MISVWPLKALLLAKKINCLGVTKITCLIQCSQLRGFSLTTFRQFTEGFLKLLSIDDLRQDVVSRKKNLYEFLRKRPPQTNNSNLEISHDQDFSLNTVEPPITATSLQRPHFFVPADSPYIVSCLKLSTTSTATEAHPQQPDSQNNLSTIAKNRQ